MLTKNDLSFVREIVQEENKPIKRSISKIQKDIKVIISLFDREHVHLIKRVDRIEDHLKLPPLPKAI